MSRISLILCFFLMMLPVLRAESPAVNASADGVAVASPDTDAGSPASGQKPYVAYFNNGAVASIRNLSTPPSDGVGGHIWFPSDGKAMHRLIHNRDKKVYLGYDLEVKPITQGGTRKLRITFKPLNISIGELLSDGVVTAEFRYMVMPKYPPAQIVEDGATIALDLLVSADGRERVTDYITVASSEEALARKQDSSKTTFHSVVRRVLVDAVVTDEKGAPVHGLKADAFRLFEDGNQQVLRSVHEYSGDAATPEVELPKLSANTYINMEQKPSRAPLNIILLDYLNTSYDNQVYIYQAIKKIEATLPADSQTAIFVLKDTLTLVQGFTKERRDLAAQDKTHIFWHYFTNIRGVTGDETTEVTVQAISNIASMVSGYKGRKNLIWLADSFYTPLSGSIIGVNGEDSIGLRGGDWFTNTRLSIMRTTTDKLVAEQVAIYTVNVAGTSGGGTSGGDGGERGTDFDSDTSNGHHNELYAQTLGPSKALFTHFEAQPFGPSWLSGAGSSWVGTVESMNLLAHDSGGAAYSSNRPAEDILTAIHDGANYYTLSYSPTNTKFDGSLRHIKVELGLKGGRIAYRHNYLADDMATMPPGSVTSGDADESQPPSSLQHGAPALNGLVFTAHVAATGVPSIATAEQMLAYSSFEDNLQRLWKENPGYLKKSFKSGAVARNLPVAEPLMVQHYTIDYAVLNNTLMQGLRSKGASSLKLRFTALAYNGEGLKVYGIVSQDEDAIDAHRKVAADAVGYRVRQTITLPVKDAVWLRLSVEDLVGKRVGSMEIYLPGLTAEPATESSSEDGTQVVPTK